MGRSAPVAFLFLLLGGSGESNEVLPTGVCECKFEGDPAVTTYDRKSYSLTNGDVSTKRYTLTQHNNFLLLPCLFNVEITISGDDSSGVLVTSVDSIEGNLGFKGAFVISRSNPTSIMLGTDRRDVPIPTDGSMIDVIANPSDQPNQQLVFTLSRNDFNAVILESKNCSGFRINYNQNNQGTIRIDKEKHGEEVEGLCGSCNDNPDDDFKKSNKEPAADVDEFIGSWLKF